MRAAVFVDVSMSDWVTQLSLYASVVAKVAEGLKSMSIKHSRVVVTSRDRSQDEPRRKVQENDKTRNG